MAQKRNRFIPEGNRARRAGVPVGQINEPLMQFGHHLSESARHRRPTDRNRRVFVVVQQRRTQVRFEHRQHVVERTAVKRSA